MKVLFLFLDGIGLGADDVDHNPFARASLPVLQDLLGGKRLLLGNAPSESQRASLLALDACLGVGGLPQSATGQAALLTGKNAPAILGCHYGPKPNPDVAAIIKNGNLFTQLKELGRSTAFLNAYPEQYFESIQSGRRLYAAIPLAVTHAGIRLRDKADLHAGRALSADFTASGWRDHIGLTDTPVITPREAGVRLAKLAAHYDFSLFEYWLSDYAGHRQDMDTACRLLETFDQALDGLLSAWDDQAGIVLITSDHGNMEDLDTRRHTANPVPCILVGAPEHRRNIKKQVKDLTDVAPAILRFIAA